MNVLSKEFSAELINAMREAFESPESKSIVLVSSKPGCFIAGADIGMLDAAGSVEEVSVVWGGGGGGGGDAIPWEHSVGSKTVYSIM